jgi:Tol biopolymer transport system component
VSIPPRLSDALSGRYAIEQELGAGGMATVYLADDLKHGRKVALKVLKPELAAIVGSERFLLEIKTTASLSHPHILPLFDSGEAAGFVYYVMPYVEGESLRARLDRERQLPVSEAVTIVTKVAGALQAAHEKGVVHRDIKPANILLSGGEPLVSDFGIALAVQQAGGGRLTETGLSLGTPFYMSPEQATADRDPDARADVYSLACVLYEMLTGEPPFTGTSAQAVLGRILTQAAPSVTASRASVPPHVDAAVRRALEKLPADRFHSASDFAAALNDPSRNAGAWGTAGAGGSADVAASGASSFRRRSATLLPWVLAAAATAAAVALVLRGATPRSSPAPIRFELGSPVGDVSFGSGDLAISADGRDIVLDGSSAGQSQLYRRSLGSTEIHPIPGTKGAEWTAISPDDRWVAFQTPGGVVKRAPLEGGAAVVMANTPHHPEGLTWSDDTHLVMGMLAFDGSHPGLTGVAIGDTTIHRITDLHTKFDTVGVPFMRHEPFSLGDGSVLYIDFDTTGIGIGVASLSDGTTRRLDLGGTAVRPHASIVGVADGVLLFVGADDKLMAVGWDPSKDAAVGEPARVPGAASSVQMARMSRNGTLVMSLEPSAYRAALVDDRGNMERLIGDPGIPFGAVRFSPDGRRAVLAAGRWVQAHGARTSADAGTWTYDFRTSLFSRLSLGIEPMTVAWSPDGRRILAVEQPKLDPSQLWSRAADASSDPKRILQWPRHHIAAMAVSPDGETLALADNTDIAAGRYDIVTTSLGGDGTLTPFAAGPANEVAPRFSPDGRFLAYASNESGRYEVYVRPFPGPGARVQISEDGGGQPTWSGDGRKIFYRSGRAIVEATLAVDARTRTLSVTGRERLFEGDFLGDAGNPRPTYDAAPDGRHFLVIRAEGDMGPRIVVWTDWIGELKTTLEAAGS